MKVCTFNLIRHSIKLVLLTLFLYSFSGCFLIEKEGCTDPDAENYDSKAEDDDGSCIYARDKFIGNYNVNENCNSGNFTYSIAVNISETDKSYVVINNLGKFGLNVRASVSDNSLNINDTQNSITFSGSGDINGNTLTIIYTASQGGTLDNCTSVCIKQ